MNAWMSLLNYVNTELKIGEIRNILDNLSLPFLNEAGDDQVLERCNDLMYLN